MTAISDAVPHRQWDRRRGSFYAFATTILWGVWGAFTGLSAERGFPETLVYCVWSLTMIPPALYALARADWQLDCDARSLIDGMIIGLLGAGGQMVLFYAVTIGPPYLIFPVISLSPIVTIAMSFLLLARTHEHRGRGRNRARAARPAAVRFLARRIERGKPARLVPAVADRHGSLGRAGLLHEAANPHMSAESIFFYMTVDGTDCLLPSPGR